MSNNNTIIIEMNEEEYKRFYRRDASIHRQANRVLVRCENDLIVIKDRSLPVDSYYGRIVPAEPEQPPSDPTSRPDELRAKMNDDAKATFEPVLGDNPDMVIRRAGVALRALASQWSASHAGLERARRVLEEREQKVYRIEVRANRLMGLLYALEGLTCGHGWNYNKETGTAERTEE